MGGLLRAREAMWKLEVTIFDLQKNRPRAACPAHRMPPEGGSGCQGGGTSRWGLHPGGVPWVPPGTPLPNPSHSEQTYK